MPTPTTSEPGRSDPAAVRGARAYAAHRSIPGPIGPVWRLLTTAPGWARWWAPDDLSATVRTLDARPGGAIDIEVDYAPARATPAWRAQFEGAGISTRFTARGTFSEVVPRGRLAFELWLDFGQRTSPHRIGYAIELRGGPTDPEVHLTAEADPSGHWTLLGRANLEGQLERLRSAVQTPIP
jgi:uncharacterized protein YndB with AHSA1/START domain